MWFSRIVCGRELLGVIMAQSGSKQKEVVHLPGFSIAEISS